ELFTVKVASGAAAVGAARRYPALISALLDRSWSEADCGKLTCGNLLRVLAQAETAAGLIQASRPPSAARIEDLDG
ncbi:MAG: hypothetical protein WAK71_25920, partial [Streptosporangiaceae bacterium]